MRTEHRRRRGRVGAGHEVRPTLQRRARPIAACRWPKVAQPTVQKRLYTSTYCAAPSTAISRKLDRDDVKRVDAEASGVGAGVRAVHHHVAMREVDNAHDTPKAAAEADGRRPVAPPSQDALPGNAWAMEIMVGNPLPFGGERSRCQASRVRVIGSARSMAGLCAEPVGLTLVRCAPSTSPAPRERFSSFSCSGQAGFVQFAHSIARVESEPWPGCTIAATRASASASLPRNAGAARRRVHRR